MTLLTEKHLDSSYFVIPKDIKDIEFMENNKMICIIKGFNNNGIPGGRRTKYGRIKAFPRTEKKIGYIVLHHSEIKTEVIQDSSVDYAGFRNNMDKSLNVYGAFYSMTPKKNKDYYVIAIKFPRKMEKLDDHLRSIRELETIVRNTYGK